MNKEKWDEEALENLFKQAPKVVDHRTKEEVFERLMNEESLNEQPPQKKVLKQGIRWTPLIASIASLFILVVIGSQFLNNDSITMQNSARDEAKLESIDEAIESESMDQASERSMVTNFSVESTAQQTLVYASQTEGVTLFEMGLADGPQIIPVSFLIPNEVVAEKTGSEKPTKLELYETFASAIDETVLGFSEFHPFKGTFREEGDVLIHTLPEEHNYDVDSAAFEAYEAALVSTFSDAYREVRLEDTNGETIMLDSMGEISEPIKLQVPERHYHYFVYQKQDGMYFLSPNFHMNSNEVTEAFQNMMIEANDLYKSVILPEVTFHVEEKEELVTITFNQPLDLAQYEPTEAMRMIEGMLLTAASFDKQIKFEQIVQETWSGFDFTKPLEKPLAGNIVFYNF